MRTAGTDPFSQPFPLLHSLLGSYDYALFEIPPEQVEDFLRSGPWDGLNVTIPYKRTAYALCDSLSPPPGKLAM
ncbi:MAG: hypothetical protein ACLUNQ_08375 [Oscillospiraceae bacterium]